MNDWTPHRRDDGELLGWIHPSGDDWVAVDVFGRTISDAVDWLVAEELLEEHGLAWLAEPWMLEDEGRPIRVRIVEVAPEHDGIRGRIVVKIDDYGDITRPAAESIVLPWPVPENLRPPRRGDPDGYTL
ncbi:hypothetical protein ACTU6U_07685 [Microbacterium sp. A196]|uniref:hypothetical protein n=1 Tax=unclassified Microbacterium TaxID=2609290 RepID=UPI003FD626D4